MGKHIRTKSKRRVNKKAVGIAVLFVLCMSVGLVYAWKKLFTDAPLNNTAGSITASESHTKYNILVLGIDKRRNDIGRSNVTCLLIVDMDKKTISMLWVPRDSRVDIPGYEWNKIGHAYAYEGPKLSEKTVSTLLGVPIDYYLAVNMEGFQHVIDAVGGVDINVDKKMYYYDPYDEGEVNNDGLIDLEPGQQHMDGNTALQYVRFRHDEMGDIGRIERQQKFSNALIEAVVQPATLTRLPEIVKEVQTSFDTNISLATLLKIGTCVPEAYQKGLNTEMVDGTPVYINNISYWLPNIEKMRDQIARLEDIEKTDSYNHETQNLAAAYRNSTKNMKVEIAR
ncbi:MAG: LCP family protein [Anaerovibrio sp.]|nr:LCP family protein [Anaerovibrio sp.]